MLRPVNSTRRRRLRISATVTAVVLVLPVIHFALTGQLPLVHREHVWSIAVSSSDRPWEFESASVVLTRDHVTDVPAGFVADPFMIRREDAWYMFFEVLNRRSGHGDIGLAIRREGSDWQYQRIVLDEPFHLSYPHVFESRGHVYMVPESEGEGEIRLYQAVDFPSQWRFVETLVRQPGLADPTVFRWRNSWWMFAGRSHTHDHLSLFYADHLQGPWVEHPQSPVIRNDASRARPGGRVVVLDDRLYRLGQDCKLRYGHKLRVFEVTQLTRHSYEEHPLSGKALLGPQASQWNNCGMHHLDLHRDRAVWLAVVDGHTKQWVFRFPGWSLGR